VTAGRSQRQIGIYEEDQQKKNDLPHRFSSCSSLDKCVHPANLKVWFKNNAVSLTTDLSDIEEWQGGDIVIFKNHIGVVSDRRNKDGVPYVIHHNSPHQVSYEEDILEKRDDLVAHYRISE